MNCSVVEWGKEGYKADTHISLGANETFDGGGGKADWETVIDLTRLGFCSASFVGATLYN